jgi:hypothetical protein
LEDIEMPSSRTVVAGLAVTAVVAGGVAAGVFLTRGTQDQPGGTAAAATTTSAAPVGSDLGIDEANPEPTASVGPDPYEGEVVATDEPVEATGEEVQVTVTFAGWNAGAAQVQVGGYVAGVIEDGGTCTLTLTKDGQTVTGRSEAVADASTTACGAVTVPGDQVSDGTWSARLAYESAAHVGTSDAWDVEVAR